MKRSEQFQYRLSKAELARLHRAAKVRGLTTSALLRKLVQDDLVRMRPARLENA